MAGEWSDNTRNGKHWFELSKEAPDWTYIPESYPPVIHPNTPIVAPAPVQIPPGDMGGIGNLNILPPEAPTKEQFERLLFILGLSEVEREFCTALGMEKDTKDLWLVYSDWLEERERIEHSYIARKKGK